MEFKKIKTQEEYYKAIEFLELLGDRDDFQEDQQLIDQFELVSTLTEAYEKEYFPLEVGHPLEIIKLKMNTLGIRQKDLVPLIGSSGVVSDVFNKKRALSKSMIRKLSDFLQIDQQILNLKYELDAKPVRQVVKTITKVQFIYLNQRSEIVEPFKTRTKENGMLFNVNAEC